MYYSTIILLICLFSFTAGLDYTYVPLVPGSELILGSSYEGAFTPNCSLAVGASCGFRVTLPKLDSDLGLSIYTLALVAGGDLSSSSSESDNITSEITVSIKDSKGSQHSSDIVYCYYTDCLDIILLEPTVSMCSPKQGDWYITIHNPGLVTASFALVVSVDNGSLFNPCSVVPAVNILEKFLLYIVIGISVVVALIIACIVTFVVCYCRMKAKRALGFSKLPININDITITLV